MGRIERGSCWRCWSRRRPVLAAAQTAAERQALGPPDRAAIRCVAGTGRRRAQAQKRQPRCPLNRAESTARLRSTASRSPAPNCRRASERRRLDPPAFVSGRSDAARAVRAAPTPPRRRRTSAAAPARTRERRHHASRAPGPGRSTVARRPQLGIACGSAAASRSAGEIVNGDVVRLAAMRRFGSGDRRRRRDRRHRHDRRSGAWRVVAIGGGATLGPQADVDGDVTVIGGPLHRDPAARVGGEIKEIGLGDVNSGRACGRRSIGAADGPSSARRSARSSPSSPR